jgi:atypical dual specificity phosphatase
MPFRFLVHDLLCAVRLRTDAGVWTLPDKLIACAYPRTAASFASLNAADIRLIVNLHTRAHRPELLVRFGFTELHLPMRDFAAPSPEILRRGVESIENALAIGRRVAVHCGAGRGRTGTLVACVLVARGSAALDAIAHVRQLRPGAVETRAQEDAVLAFERRGSNPPNTIQN